MRRSGVLVRGTWIAHRIQHRAGQPLEKIPLAALVTLLAVLSYAPAARATVFSSIPITVVGGGGEFASCSLANVSTKPLAALAPAPHIQIQLFHGAGTDITAANSCGASLAPGQVCDAAVFPAGFSFVYCKVTFSGSKTGARASLKREDGGNNTLVAVLVQ
jgi:hypothetical protein